MTEEQIEQKAEEYKESKRHKIEPRTLGRFKKVKAWKYVDFPQELNNGKERT